jgi:hypothetical protein
MQKGTQIFSYGLRTAALIAFYVLVNSQAFHAESSREIFASFTPDGRLLQSYFPLALPDTVVQ